MRARTFVESEATIIHASMDRPHIANRFKAFNDE